MSRVAGASAALILDKSDQMQTQAKSGTDTGLSVVKGPAMLRSSELEQGLGALGFQLEAEESAGSFYRVDKVVQKDSRATFTCKSPLFKNAEAGTLLAKEASLSNTLANECPRHFPRSVILQTGQPISVLTEYVPCSLQERIREGGMNEDLALSCFFQAGEALNTMANNNVFHSDVNPSIFRLTADNDVKVVDLNLKDGSEDLAVAHTVVYRADAPSGSVKTATQGKMRRYIAPEMLDGWEVDSRTNVFQLGAMLYEMLTGKPPLGRFQNLPQNLSRLNPVIDKALASNPDDRYADVKEMMEAVQKETSRTQEGYKVLPPSSSRKVEVTKCFFKELGRRILTAARLESFLLMPLNYGTAHRREWARNSKLDPPRGREELGEQGLHAAGVILYTLASSAATGYAFYKLPGALDKPWYFLPAVVVASNVVSIAYELIRSAVIAARKVNA